MAKLTKQQIKFLGDRDISVSDSFDATGMTKSQYRDVMRNLGKLVAYGVTPCRAKRHTLRTRAGHCAQCNPANLRYLSRHGAGGEIYVAESLSTGLVKIGLSGNTTRRIASLNSTLYGDCNDWAAQFVAECTEMAGAIESRAHNTLHAYQAKGIYYMNVTVERECSELFWCDVDVAIDAVQSALYTC